MKLCRYLAQQWPPEQHLAPVQQSARCDVAVAVPIVARAIIIIKRYFIKVPPVEFDYISLTCERADDLMVRRAAAEQADDRIVMMKRRFR